MSKAKAKARKKARLAKLQAAASAPAVTHAAGEDSTPADQVADKPHPGKFDARSPAGGGMRNTGGKTIPNLAASTRGSARSR